MEGIRSVLIKDTTREERIRIVNRSLAVCGSHLVAAGPTPSPHAKGSPPRLPDPWSTQAWAFSLATPETPGQR